jgi:NAD-dependent dihydropyrimidine dehydrogenase PreA subunit
MSGNLARIDPDTCAGTKVCVEKCPTGAMVDLFQTS